MVKVKFSNAFLYVCREEIKTTHHVSDIELYRQGVDNCNICRTRVMLYPEHYKQVNVKNCEIEVQQGLM